MSPNRSRDLLQIRQRKKLHSSSLNNISFNDSYIDRTIRATEIQSKLSRSLTWGCINATVFTLLCYDLIDRCNPSWTFIQMIEFCLSVIVFVNMIYYLCSYIYYFKVKPVESTKLELSDCVNKDSSFASLPSSINESGLTNTSLNITAFSFDRSRYVDSEMNPVLNNPSLLNISTMISTSVPNETVYSNSIINTSFSGHKLIENETELRAYLDDYYKNEKLNSTAFPEKKFTEGRLPIWSHPSSIEPPPDQIQLAQNQYQLSYVIADNTNSKNKTPPLQIDEISFWNKKGIYTKDPSSMCEDLRIWISSTILSRLAKEITFINDYFMKHGYTDLRIGQTCLEKLRKCASMQNVPNTVTALLPFLEYSNCHNYIAHRIIELAKGTCMSEFRWKAGSLIYNGKPWDKHLPTDSELIMHLIATYFDGQLVPLPQQPEGKPFSSQYLCTNVSEKPIRVPGTIKIYQTQVHPPNYVLVEDMNVHAPQKGCNNLFHTIILFLHYIKTKENGMLGRVSLGPAGINILWVTGGN